MLWIAGALPLLGQSVQVFSEFRRTDSTGQILAADRGGTPREILSPAMARNAYHSYHVLVRAPEKTTYYLHIAQNPEQGLEVKLYREAAIPEGNRVVDRLEPVKLPAKGRGGGTDVFLLDVWVPPLTKVSRVRLEAQLFDGTGWTIYPMEVRIVAAIVPETKMTGAELPPAAEASVSAARQVLLEHVCGLAPPTAPIALSARQLIRRNALQDMELARGLEKTRPREEVIAGMMKAIGVPDAASFCSAARVHSALGPEWYLKLRDYLYREASR